MDGVRETLFRTGSIVPWETTGGPGLGGETCYLLGPPNKRFEVTSRVKQIRDIALRFHFVHLTLSTEKERLRTQLTRLSAHTPTSNVPSATFPSPLDPTRPRPSQRSCETSVSGESNDTNRSRPSDPPVPSPTRSEDLRGHLNHLFLSTILSQKASSKAVLDSVVRWLVEVPVLVSFLSLPSPSTFPPSPSTFPPFLSSLPSLVPFPPSSPSRKRRLG